MFWNDPNLYGATLPFKDIPLGVAYPFYRDLPTPMQAPFAGPAFTPMQAPFLGPAFTPMQAPFLGPVNPWQTLPRMVPQAFSYPFSNFNVPVPTAHMTPYNVNLPFSNWIRPLGF